MPRPIILTDKLKQKAREDFAEMLNNIKMSDGKFNYSKSFKYETSNAVVWIKQEAYRKMIALVTEFSDEVGWHGTVSRSENDEYIIEDIFVYPQEVTGSTVNTNQEKYTKWLYELDDETFNKIRMQGHSHVNMGVLPSNVDNKHREQILDQLEKNMFYIFMIWNKSLTIHTTIYDMSKNILYEDDDIEVKLIGDENMNEFLTDAKEKVQKINNEAKIEKPQKHGKFDDYPIDYDYYYACEMYDRYDLGGVSWRA